jgi:hypothetical protein
MTRASAAAYAALLTFAGVASDLLVRYVPGDPLAAATATRASIATFAGNA